MIFIGVGIVIEVETIGVGEMGLNVETFWTGGDGIRVSVMRFGMKAHTADTC